MTPQSMLTRMKTGNVVQRQGAVPRVARFSKCMSPTRRCGIVRGQGQPIMAPRTQDLGGDPFGLLLRQRIVFLGGEVNDFIADAIVSQMMLLDAMDSTKDIKLFINSPGS